MIIKKVSVQRFGVLRDFRAKFESGLNIIKGPNESGKSTLQQALLLALFEPPRITKALSSFRTWGEDRYFEFYVLFEFNENESWVLFKDFENKRQELNVSHGEKIKHKYGVSQMIETALGTNSIKVFRSTACVQQDQIADLSEGRKDISRILEEIVTGGADDVSTLAAIDKLDKAIKAHRRGMTRPVQHPGPIARLQKEQDALRKKVDAYRAAIEERNSLEEELQAAKEQLEEVTKRLTVQLEIQEKLERKQVLEKNLEQWSTREARLEKRLEDIEEVEQALSQARETLAALSSLDKLTAQEYDELLQLHARVQTLQEQKERAEAEAAVQWASSPTPEIVKPTSRRLLIPGLMAFSGMICFFLGVLGAVLADTSLALLALLGIILFIGGGVWLLIRAMRSQSAVSLQPPQQIISLFDEKPLIAAEKDLQEKLAALQCTDIDDLQDKFRRVQKARRKEEDAKAHLNKLFADGLTREELVRQRKTASRKRRDAEEGLEDPGLQHIRQMNAVQIQSMLNDLKALQDRQQELQERILRLEGQLLANRTSREDLLRTEERLSVVEAQLEREQDHLDAYTLALKIMQQAREMALSTAEAHLGPKVSSYLKTLTLGRYDRVEMDSNLNIRLRLAEHPDGFIHPSQLSKGAQDQLFFAARLALIDLIFPNANPPMFLDDPFVKFDPDRRQAAIELCQTIAKSRQVFLFTCSDDYDDSGHVIQMPPKSAPN